MMTDQQLLILAIDFAAEKHRDQRRKDVTQAPYINHPLSLLRFLSIRAGISDINVLCSAVLHDVLEDTNTTQSELRSLFGEHILSIVLEVTDDKKLPWKTRKQLQIETAPHLSYEATMVKYADKTCNLYDFKNGPPVGWSNQRCLEYFDWAAAVVTNMKPHPVLTNLFWITHETMKIGLVPAS